MNAVEKLQTAIDKLERLKAETSPGPWVQHDGYNASELGETVRIKLRPHFYAAAYTGTPVNADLIVTLHRTIDAQRVILTFAYNQLVREIPGFDLSPEYRHAVVLAKAILGEE